MPLHEFLAVMAAAFLQAAAPFLPFIAAGLLVSLWACHRPTRRPRGNRRAWRLFRR